MMIEGNAKPTFPLPEYAPNRQDADTAQVVVLKSTTARMDTNNASGEAVVKGSGEDSPSLVAGSGGGSADGASGTQGGDDDSLHAAAYAGHCDTVQRFLDEGCDPDLVDDSNDLWNGGSPLCYAAVKGQHAAMRALLDAGAEIEARFDGTRNHLPQSALMSRHV